MMILADFNHDMLRAAQLDRKKAEFLILKNNSAINLVESIPHHSMRCGHFFAASNNSVVHCMISFHMHLVEICHLRIELSSTFCA